MSKPPKNSKGFECSIICWDAAYTEKSLVRQQNTPSMTLKIYTHLDESNKNKAIKQLDQFLSENQI